MVLEAYALKQKGCKIIDESAEELQEALEAQKEAERMVDEANKKTEYALAQEVRGQEKLVEAGKFIKTTSTFFRKEINGSRYEALAEASHKGTYEVDTNVLVKTKIQKDIQIDVPEVPKPEIHIMQNRIGAEPILEQKN